MQERVSAVARHGGFFISDLIGRASLGKSGAGENGAEHSINRGCGKAQREMDGLPGWGIMGAKARLRCFGGKGTGQTAQGVKGKGKEKTLKEGLSFLDLGVLGRVYFTDT